MAPNYTDWFAGGLYEESLVVLELFSCFQDRIQCFMVTGCIASAPEDDQIIRVFGYIRIKIIEQHTVCGLLLPTLAVQASSSGCSRPTSRCAILQLASSTTLV
jgi:hypothetical protein